MFYVLPLFVIATLSVSRIPRSDSMRGSARSGRRHALLPALIPYSTVVNRPLAVDSFGLVMFARTIPHVGVTSVQACGRDPAALARRPWGSPMPWRARKGCSSSLSWRRSSSGCRASSTGCSAAPPDSGRRILHGEEGLGGQRRHGARGGPPRAPPRRAGARSLAVSETTFFNLTVSRLYYPCQPTLGAEFGEPPVTLDAGGRVRSGEAVVRARYAVVPAGFGVVGRVVARDRRGGLVLVAPVGGVLRVATGQRLKWTCAGVEPAGVAVRRRTTTSRSWKSTTVPG